MKTPINLLITILFTSLPLNAAISKEATLFFSFENFVSQYSTIHTIAGKGDYSKKYINGWRTEYEKDVATNAELSRPHHAIRDSMGNIYVADKDAHAIRAIRPNGIIETIAGTNVKGFNGDGVAKRTQLSYPNGIFITSRNVLFILDLGNSKIRKLHKDGTISTIFTDPNGIKTGRGLWVSDDEKVIYYSSRHQLKRWTQSKGIEVVAIGFEELGNIAMSPNNVIFVTDRDAHLVYSLDQFGNTKIEAGNGKTYGGATGSHANTVGLNEVRGIWFHPNGGYFLATHKGGQISMALT